jgi:hypothetical protein
VSCQQRFLPRFCVLQLAFKARNVFVEFAKPLVHRQVIFLQYFGSMTRPRLLDQRGFRQVITTFTHGQFGLVSPIHDLTVQGFEFSIEIFLVRDGACCGGTYFDQRVFHLLNH